MEASIFVGYIFLLDQLHESLDQLYKSIPIPSTQLDTLKIPPTKVLAFHIFPRPHGHNITSTAGN